MHKNTKIATCCYCGTRAALVLSGDTQHILACSACGAPLSQMRAFKTGDVDAKRHRTKASKKPHQATRKGAPTSAKELKSLMKKAKKLKKARKMSTSRLLYTAFDVLEDIFD